ncbi:MAG: c-type cytochrome [Verrucomicrobiales bacterium]
MAKPQRKAGGGRPYPDHRGHRRRREGGQGGRLLPGARHRFGARHLRARRPRAALRRGGSFWLIDDDGNGKADRKEMMFTKTGGKQHDHGIHAFHFGADGKLYFNFGNAAKQLCDKDGNIITDKAGNEVRANRQPYQEGMVFRCDLDGSNVETLGWNFRNNWEVASDSFGALWQSDNDDDGNRGVRINYVMEFGNFGYKDELTGAGWNQQRVGWEEEIPLRHWHLNDPGVVPNLLQTGAGSPTGIIVYEGDLLPEVFRGQVIHCDAGPNVVRAYPAKKSGAGYEAETVDILKGDGDRWFRPSDVVAAPDGSLIVADWYDPGVGGHGMGDLDRGRLFRVAPPAVPYRVPKLDFSTVEGAAQALGNANLEARYLAWQKLHAAGETAIPALKKLWESDNPRLRARAFWLLAKIPGKGADFVNLALKDSDADLRVAAVRAARQLGMDLHAVVAGLAADPAPEVRRECAIALAHDTTPEAAALWAKLAAQHAAGDRWYLEALGIGMRAQPEACFKAWRAAVGEAALQSGAGKDIVWRSRVPEAMPLLVAYAKAAPDAAARGRYLRAFDFMPDGDARRAALIDLLVAGAGQDASQYAMQKLGKIDLHSSPELKAAVAKQIDATRGTAPYVETVALFDLKDETAGLEKIVEASNEASDLRAAAAKVLLDWGKAGDFLAKIRAGDAERAKGLLALMPKIQNGGALEVLKAAVLDAKLPNEIRHAAIESCRDFRNAEVFLANLAIRQQIPEGFTPALTHFLHASRDGQIREAAAKHLPLPEGAGGEKLPPLAELAKRKGNADSGKAMFAKGTCITCHRVAGQGIEFGPDLSEIGGKLAREDMFRAILDPGAAISHGFATVEVNAKNGDSAVGYVVSDTDDTLSIKIPGGLVRDFKKADLKSHNELPISLMPAGLEKILTAQELVDLVAYLETLGRQK